MKPKSFSSISARVSSRSRISCSVTSTRSSRQKSSTGSRQTKCTAHRCLGGCRDNDLLPLTQHLDLLWPARHIHKGSPNLGKRLGRAEQHGPLWRVAKAHGNFAPIGKPVLCIASSMRAAASGSVMSASRPGLFCSTIPGFGSCPPGHLLGTCIGLCLPSPQYWALSLARDRGEPRAFSAQPISVGASLASSPPFIRPEQAARVARRCHPVCTES